MIDFLDLQGFETLKTPKPLCYLNDCFYHTNVRFFSETDIRVHTQHCLEIPLYFTR
jgi:hypothetical protein